jgi:hypothetical protein
MYALQKEKTHFWIQNTHADQERPGCIESTPKQGAPCHLPCIPEVLWWKEALSMSGIFNLF